MADETYHVVAAGNDLYAFPPGDNRWEYQELVCVGANLDTEVVLVPSDMWPSLKAELMGLHSGIVVHDFAEESNNSV